MPDEDPGQFAELLRGVRARLGCGPVLNTSFNIHGQLLVCTPAHALDVLVRSGAEWLAIGPFLVAGVGTSAGAGLEAFAREDGVQTVTR